MQTSLYSFYSDGGWGTDPAHRQEMLTYLRNWGNSPHTSGVWNRAHWIPSWEGVMAAGGSDESGVVQPPTVNDHHPYVPAGVLRVVVRSTRRRRGRGRGRGARGRGMGARRRGRGVQGRGRGAWGRGRGGGWGGRRVIGGRGSDEVEPPRRRLRRVSSSSEEEFVLNDRGGGDGDSDHGGDDTDTGDEGGDSDESVSTCGKCGSREHETDECFLKLGSVVRVDFNGEVWDADIVFVHKSARGGYRVQYYDNERNIESNVPASRISPKVYY